MTTKFLFAIFIAEDIKYQKVLELNPLDPIFKAIDQELKGTQDNKADTVKKSNAQLDRLEQFGHYWDVTNRRIVFFGVADSRGIVNVIDGEAKLTGSSPANRNNSNTKASEFMRAICDNIRRVFPNVGALPNDKCTWIVVPLDELAAGDGTLFVEGMAGESGGG